MELIEDKNAEAMKQASSDLLKSSTLKDSQRELIEKITELGPKQIQESILTHGWAAGGQDMAAEAILESISKSPETTLETKVWADDLLKERFDMVKAGEFEGMYPAGDLMVDAPNETIDETIANIVTDTALDRTISMKDMMESLKAQNVIKQKPLDQSIGQEMEL
jgi:hypothetical protein